MTAAATWAPTAAPIVRIHGQRGALEVGLGVEHPPLLDEHVEWLACAAAEEPHARLLRPGEALGPEWRHVRERTLVVEQAISDGRLRASRTGDAPERYDSSHHCATTSSRHGRQAR